MKGHGGARKNAGRSRAVPNILIRMAIGGMCENARQEHVTKIVNARIESRRQKIRAIQETINAENARRIAIVERLQFRGAASFSIDRAQADLEKWQAIALKKIRIEVMPTLEKLGRGISTEDYRPRALPRAQVYREVIAECVRLGFGKISTHQVRDCWREYRKFQKT